MAPSDATPAIFNRQLSRGRPMDLFQLIRQDHQKAKRLFERLAETAGGTQSRPRLFAELKHELELHAEVEEKYFYPALRSHDDAKDLIEEALEEHGDMKEALVALDRGDKESDSWTDRLDELQEDVEHHVEEEEGEIFPLAQKLLDSTQLNTIAGEIEKAKAMHKAAK
jgi:hemerythrin superfamily protein